VSRNSTGWEGGGEAIGGEDVRGERGVSYDQETGGGEWGADGE